MINKCPKTDGKTTPLSWSLVSVWENRPRLSWNLQQLNMDSKVCGSTRPALRAFEPSAAWSATWWSLRWLLINKNTSIQVQYLFFLYWIQSICTLLDSTWYSPKQELRIHASSPNAGNSIWAQQYGHTANIWKFSSKKCGKMTIWSNKNTNMSFFVNTILRSYMPNTKFGKKMLRYNLHEFN